MPYRTTVDPAARLGFALFTGAVTGADLLGATRAVYEHAAWETRFDSVWDAERIGSLDLLPGDIEQLVALKTAWCQGACGRDVLVSRGADAITSALFVHLARGQFEATYVVGSMEQALRTLGRDALPAPLEAALFNDARP